MRAQHAGAVVAGRYVLVRPLASGGMGSVWVAVHRDLAVEVAIKFMALSIADAADARARFEREAKVVARLDSQHVVQVLDYGVEDDTPYMVMELLKGESLSARLSRGRRLSLGEAARLVVQVGKALRTAHVSGLVHRDLKPANVFLALKDDDEVAKVLDFGVAKAAGFFDATAETASGIMIGSIHYMSPEQVRCSRAVDHRSDLWSLGVILYRALTGRLPFPGDLGDVLAGICAGRVPPPTSVASDLPPALDAFFARALACNADLRFASARELSEAFCAIALGAPPTQPSPPAERRWLETARLDDVPTTYMGARAAEQARSHAPTPVSTPSTPKAWAHLTDEVQRLAARHDLSPTAPPTPITQAPLAVLAVRASARSRLPARAAVVLLVCAGIIYTALGLRLVSARAPSNAHAAFDATELADAAPSAPSAPSALATGRASGAEDPVSSSPCGE